MSANAPSIADLLAAAEPSEPRPFGELISRLTADGRLRGARDGGRAIGPAALAGIEVRGITDDSRKVGRGALFVAVPGLHVDGHDFVAAAARAGAVAALVERPVVDVTLPQLVVDRAPRALAADRVHGIAYDVAILTNLTHEHIEFHGSWEAYRDAKLSLFERLARGPANPPKEIAGRAWPKAAIVNADDPNAGAFVGVS